MKIQVEIDKSSELTTFSLRGELDFNEFLEKTDRKMLDEPTQAKLLQL